MTNDKLHDLIQTLTKSEKRYFKLFSKKTNPKGEQNYVKLFDALETLEVYEERQLTEILDQNNVNYTYLSADKNYLYKLVLSSLRSFHSSKTSRIRLKQYLDYAEILLDKSLQSQALQQIKKAKKLAEKYDLFSYLPGILQLERKLLGYPVKMKELDELYDHYNSAMERLQDYNELDFLYRRSFWIRRKIGKARNTEDLKAFDVVIEHPLMKKDHTLLSFSAQLRYFQIWATYYYSKDDWKQEYQCNKNLVELMSSKKEFIEEHPYDYASTFSRMLILTKMAEPEAYFQTLEKFKNIPEQVSRDKRKVKSLVYSIVYSTETVRMIKEGKYDEAQRSLLEYELFLKEFDDLVDDAFIINFYYKFAYICIGVDDYSKALDYINHLLNRFDEKLRPDIFSYSKILAIVIHLELRNFEIIPYIAKATANHLKKRKRFYQTEELLFDFFKKIKTPMPKSLLLSYMAELRQNLKDVFKNNNNKKALDYFDFVTWLDSRIEGISFLEAKQKNLKM